jgi:hypothetical protein
MKIKKLIMTFDDDNTFTYYDTFINSFKLHDIIPMTHLNGCIYDCEITKMDGDKIYLKKLRVNSIFYDIVQKEKEKYD